MYILPTLYIYWFSYFVLIPHNISLFIYFSTLYSIRRSIAGSKINTHIKGYSHLHFKKIFLHGSVGLAIFKLCTESYNNDSMHPDNILITYIHLVWIRLQCSHWNQIGARSLWSEIHSLFSAAHYCVCLVSEAGKSSFPGKQEQSRILIVQPTVCYLAA